MKQRKINDTKSQFFRKVFKLYKSDKTGKERDRDERGDSCTDSADIKISIYYKKFHAHKLNSLNKIDSLLKNTNATEMK